MRVFHDDLRPAPDGWEWARTNDEAKVMLKTGEVEAISLDYDMGLHEVDPEAAAGDPSYYYHLRGTDADNGMRLVEWMVEQDLVPKQVTIHSWNTTGARSMYLHLNEHGFDCVYEAYSP